MDPATEPRTVPSGPELEELTGIGDVSARALRDIGVDTTEALAASDTEHLSSALARLHRDGNAKTDWSPQTGRFIRVAQDALRLIAPPDKPPTDAEELGTEAPPSSEDIDDGRESMRITLDTDPDGAEHWIIHTDVQVPADSNVVVLVVTDDGNAVHTGTASPDSNGSTTAHLPDLTTGEYRCFGWIQGPLSDDQYHKPLVGPLIRVLPRA